MAQQYDGSIRIQIDADDEKAAKKIEQLNSKYARQLESVNKQTAAVGRLRDAYSQLVSGDVEPKSIKQMEKDIQRAEKEAAGLDTQLQALNNRASIERAVDGGISPQTQAQIDEVAQRLFEADRKADLLKKNLAEVRLDPSASAEAKKLAEDIQLGGDKLERLTGEAQQTKSALEGIAQGVADSGVFVRLGNALSRIGTSLTGSMVAARSAVNSLTGKVSRFGRESKKSFSTASAHASKFGGRLKSLIAGAFVFNIIRRGLREVAKLLGSMLRTNTQFTQSLSQIKSNLLTAFQPIYEAILPWLNMLMSALSQITAQMASFVSTIFGTSATQAQKNAQALYDQANATEKAGNAAEKASKQLASFDTIQKLSSPQSNQSEQQNPTAPVFDTDFTKIKTPEWLSDWWGVFQESWKQQGQKTIDAAKKAISSIKTVISEIGKSFMSVWTNGTGVKFLNNIQKLLQTIFGIIGDIATAFANAWRKNDTGTRMIQAIFDAINRVIELIGSIGEAFRAAWNSGLGESILSHIFSIITNIFDVVGNLVGRFREAWEANGNGEAIMTAILGLVNSILGTIGNIITATAEWAKNLDLEPLISGIRGVLEPLKGVIDIIGEALGEIWKEVALPFAKWVVEQAIPTILRWLGSFFTFLTNNKEGVIAFIKTIALLFAAFKTVSIITTAIEVFKALFGALTPLKVILALMIPLIAGVIGAWKDMSALERVISVLGLLVVGAAAAAIAVGALQSAWSLGLAAAAIVAGVVAITSAINSSTKRANSAGSFSGGGISGASASTFSTASLPHLAEGAVISPNHEFLAVLGDQRRGVNIETPLATMKQAFAEVIAESGIGNASNVNVNFTGSMAQLVRQMNPKITVEQNRAGNRLVKGGSY